MYYVYILPRLSIISLSLHSLWLVEVPGINCLLGPNIEAPPGQDLHLCTARIEHLQADHQLQVLGGLLGCLLLTRAALTGFDLWASGGNYE